jgi:hypothetical protein
MAVSVIYDGGKSTTKSVEVIVVIRGNDHGSGAVDIGLL